MTANPLATSSLASGTARWMPFAIVGGMLAGIDLSLESVRITVSG